MRRSFSFLECSIVLALVAAAATVAIPRWASDRIVENEERAVEVLGRIADAQKAFHARCGTFGLLKELAGTHSPRGLQVLPACLVAGEPSLGALERNGYLFSVYLPSIGGHGALGHLEVDAEAAKRAWIAYAWPAHYGITGRRLFVVTSTGDVFAHENSVSPLSSRETRPFAGLAWSKLDPKTPFREPANWVKKVRWDPVRR